MLYQEIICFLFETYEPYNYTVREQSAKVLCYSRWYVCLPVGLFG